MGRQLPQVAVRPDDLPDLRQATREAHEAVQALREAKRDLEATWEAIKVETRAQIQAAIDIEMATAREDIAKGRTSAIEKIIRSMDRFWSELVGVDGGSMEPPRLQQLLREKVVDRIDLQSEAVARHMLWHEERGDRPVAAGPVTEDHINRAVIAITRLAEREAMHDEST
jgi:hypothetical protein